MGVICTLRSTSSKSSLQCGGHRITDGLCARIVPVPAGRSGDSRGTAAPIALRPRSVPCQVSRHPHPASSKLATRVRFPSPAPHGSGPDQRDVSSDLALMRIRWQAVWKAVPGTRRGARSPGSRAGAPGVGFGHTEIARDTPGTGVTVRGGWPEVRSANRARPVGICQTRPSQECPGGRRPRTLSG